MQGAELFARETCSWNYMQYIDRELLAAHENNRSHNCIGTPPVFQLSRFYTI